MDRGSIKIKGPGSALCKVRSAPAYLGPPCAKCKVQSAPAYLEAEGAKCKVHQLTWRLECKVQSAPAHLEAGGDKRHMIPHPIPVLQCIVPTSLFPGLHKGFSDVRDFPSSPPLFILHNKDSPTPRPKNHVDVRMDWPSLLTRTMMLLRGSALHRPRSMVSLVCHKFCLCRLPHSTP
jgi:hypothetical protein